MAEQAKSSSSSSKPVHPLFPTFLGVVEDADASSQHVCSDPSPSAFNVRGPSYLKDRKKVHPSTAQYSLLGIDFVTLDGGSNVMQDVARFPFLSFRRARERGFKGFVFMLNFDVIFGNFVCYWTPARNVENQSTPKDEGESNSSSSDLKPYLTGDRKFDNVMTKFVEGDDEYRDKRLKILPLLVEGNWILRKAVNGRPAILGTKIDVVWHKDLSPGECYMSADICVSSSTAAQGILSLVRMYVQNVTLDLGFAIEGATEEELPECLMCALRFHHLDESKTRSFEELEEEYLACRRHTASEFKRASIMLSAAHMSSMRAAADPSDDGKPRKSPLARRSSLREGQVEGGNPRNLSDGNLRRLSSKKGEARRSSNKRASRSSRACISGDKRSSPRSHMDTVVGHGGIHNEVVAARRDSLTRRSQLQFAHDLEAAAADHEAADERARTDKAADERVCTDKAADEQKERADDQAESPVMDKVEDDHKDDENTSRSWWSWS